MVLLISLLGLGLELWLSKAIAAETAIVNNFFWNVRLTFADRSTNESAALTFFKYNMACTSGIVLGAAALSLQVEMFGVPVVIANGAAIVLICFWNYLLCTRIWREPGRNRS